MNGHENRTAKRLGKSVQDARRAAGWTQVDLSLLLRRRGLKWSPAIVSLVENGDRRLQFVEAVILVRLLDPFGLTLAGLADEVPVIPGVEEGEVDVPEWALEDEDGNR